MKKYILISILALLAMSCNNANEQKDENPEVSLRIAELEKENKALKDSISQMEFDFLQSQIIIGIPDDEVLKVGKENNIKFILHTFDRKVPKYEVFDVTGGKQKSKIMTGDKTMFEYKFVPKSVNDNNLELMLKMPYGKRTFEIPAAVRFRVEK